MSLLVVCQEVWLKFYLLLTFGVQVLRNIRGYIRVSYGNIGFKVKGLTSNSAGSGCRAYRRKCYSAAGTS